MPWQGLTIGAKSCEVGVALRQLSKGFSITSDIALRGFAAQLEWDKPPDIHNRDRCFRCNAYSSLAAPGSSGAASFGNWSLRACSVVNLDKLTYAGNLDSLAAALDDPLHVFVNGDIGDSAKVNALLDEYRPRADRPFSGRIARRSLD